MKGLFRLLPQFQRPKDDDVITLIDDNAHGITIHSGKIYNALLFIL